MLFNIEHNEICYFYVVSPICFMCINRCLLSSQTIYLNNFHSHTAASRRYFMQLQCTSYCSHAHNHITLFISNWSINAHNSNFSFTTLSIQIIPNTGIEIEWKLIHIYKVRCVVIARKSKYLCEKDQRNRSTLVKKNIDMTQLLANICFIFIFPILIEFYFYPYILVCITVKGNTATESIKLRHIKIIRWNLLKCVQVVKTLHSWITTQLSIQRDQIDAYTWSKRWLISYAQIEFQLRTDRTNEMNYTDEDIRMNISIKQSWRLFPQSIFAHENSK